MPACPVIGYQLGGHGERERGSILLSLTVRARASFFSLPFTFRLICFALLESTAVAVGLTVFVLPPCGTIAHARRREQFLIEKAPLKKMILNEGEGGRREAAFHRLPINIRFWQHPTDGRTARVSARLNKQVVWKLEGMGCDCERVEETTPLSLVGVFRRDAL